MSIVYQEHRELLEAVAKGNGFEKYELEEQSGSDKGDGYVSEIIKITIKNEDKKLHVILKSALTDENVRNSIPLDHIFKREIWVYENILPQLTKFQTDNGLLHGFEGYAKCYGTCTKLYREAIVLEDLIANGYRLWNRKIPMNHEHISLAMREYGKLHAVSLAKHQKDPEQFEQLKKFFESSEQQKEEQKQHWKMFLSNAEDKIRKAIEGNAKLEEGLKKLINGAEKFFLELEANENQIVFNHGDCWCNNIFFKYESPQDNTPSKVCFIDWQIANMRPPVYDISYFFSTSSPKDILYDYQTYLKTYHDSLSESLRSMSCDPEEIYPFSKLEEDWRKFSKIALYLAPVVFSVLVVDKEDVGDFKKNVKSAKDFFEQLSNAGRAEAAAHQKTRDLMTFMIDNNFV